jgi:hypothetical protein
VTSQVNPQQHKQPTNTTTMVVEPLAPPVAWIQWIHTTRGGDSLAHILSKAAVEGCCLIHWINVEIDIFVSTSMFNWIRAFPLATKVAKMASIAVGSSPSLNIVIDIILTHF